VLQKKDIFIDSLHIFILFSLALARPLYVLSRNSEFFVAHNSKPLDVISLVLVLLILIPLFFILIEVVAGLISQRLRKTVHYCTIALLFSIITLTVLKTKAIGFSGITILAGTIIFGILITLAYIRFQEVRKFLSILFPAIFIFPYFFLFDSPVAKIVFPKKEPQAIYTEVNAENPVIFVVFDEFPTTSLMDEHHQIDPILYPNFAALAQDSTWFRNATSVHESTHFAVPAILSGSYPEDSSKLPIATDYPHNLFTLLGGSYDMKLFEALTTLCPATSCDQQNHTNRQPIYTMLSDLFFVYLHIILPTDLTSGLPVITQTWKNFKVQLNERRKTSFTARPEIFSQFVESINISKKPTLYFIHIMLPHVPWKYLPSGKLYTLKETDVPGLIIKKEKWSNNEWLVLLNYQRHLLQIGFVDKLLGDLIEKLKKINLYDSSLIIVTADHGVSFMANDFRRPLNKTNFQDIMPVPLFIKKPNQYEGIISDRNVEAIDILPTVADVLNIPLPWTVDGYSVFDTSLPERKEKIMFIKNSKDHLVFEPDSLKSQYTTLKRKLKVFGSGTEPDSLFKFGPYQDLVNQSVNDFEIIKDENFHIELDNKYLFINIDPKDSFIPAQITGSLLQDRDKLKEVNLAVAINGTIRAVTKTFQMEDKETRFSVIVAERSFRKGRNDVEILLISDENRKLRLVSTKHQEDITYFLKTETIITSSNGITIPITPDALKGYIQMAEIKHKNIIFGGWAADINNSELPETIIIFVNGKFFFSGKCNMKRPDVAEYYKNHSFIRSGFQYRFPLQVFEGISDAEIRLFAVSKTGSASELIYPNNYKWSRKL
jgi:hypothetical protein